MDSLSRSNRLLTVITVSLAAFAGLIQAHPNHDTVMLEPMEVDGRAADLLGDAATSSEGQVGTPEIAVRPLLRRGEVLEVVPGMIVTQHSGSGKANQYFLRGFNLDHGTDFAVTVDGMPANLRSHAHGQGYADTNFIIPELIARIDYQKGAFAAENGNFSAAGAAQFHLVDSLPQGFAKAEFGENRHARAVVAETIHAAANPGAASTVGAEAAYQDGPWEKAEAARRLNAFARHSWSGRSGDYSVTFMGYDGRWNSTDQIPLRAVRSGALDRFGNIDPTDGGESSRVSLSFDGLVYDRDDSTGFNLYAIRSDLDLYSNFTYFFDDAVNGDQFNQREDRYIVGGSVRRELARELAGCETRLSFGVQLRNDFNDVGLHRTAGRTRLSTVRSDEVTESSAGLFVEGSMQFTPWLRGIAGARGDFHVFDVESPVPADSGDKTAAIFSPKVGLVAGPWAKTNLYTNAGLGFHSNDARGVTAAVNPSTPLVRAKNVEAGVRTAFVPGLVSTVSVWWLEFDSELVYIGDAGVTEAGSPSRRHGVEFNNFYRVSSWLALDADLAFTNARYLDTPAGMDRIVNSIDTVFSAGASVDFDNGWFGALRARYFGPQPLVEDGGVTAPSSLTFNARAGYRTGEWEFAVDVFNVFDRDNYDIVYYYESRLAGEAAPVSDIHFHPAEPRSFRVSATRRF